MTTMKVSRRLAELEKELGVRLFQRTTRVVMLTNEGEQFMPYALSITEADNAAKSMFKDSSSCPSGQLRITAPTGIGRRHILPLLHALMRDNTGIKVDLNLTEDTVDIISQGYDIAVRVADLKDSQLIAHKICDNPRVLCASPEYIKLHGAPTKLNELSDHACLKTSAVSCWFFEENGLVKTVEPDSRFNCSNIEGIREMCLAGAGISQLTRLDIYDELLNGKLTEIMLEDASSQNLAVWAVLPTRKFIPRRVSFFLDELKDSFGSLHIK